MFWLGAILIVLSLPLFIGAAINKDAPGNRNRLGGLLLIAGIVIVIIGAVAGR